MTIKERTYEFIKYKGLKVSQFEAMCGLSNGYVSSMRKGFGEDKLNNVLKMFPELDRQWILFGEGKMLKDGDTGISQTDSAIYPYVDRVPLVPLNALGGSLVGFSEDSVRSSDCELVRSPVDNAEFAIPVFGDSMEPVYPSGCRVFVKKIDMSAFIVWGNTYVLDTVNGIILKEVQPSEQEGCIICHSKNPSGQYKDFEVNLKDVRGMYRVMACLIAM